MEDELVIHNGELIFPGSGQIGKGDLRLSGKKIEEVRLSGERLEARGEEQEIEAEGFYVSPGFIDLQVNGGAGVDFLNPDSSGLERFTELSASHGTTSFLATVITNPIETMNESMRKLHSFGLSNCLGFHVEGPFLSKEKKGAHDRDYVKQYSGEKFEELVGGVEENVKVFTFAPEADRIPELIRDLSSINATPSIGHTNATYKNSIKTLEEGAKGFTHLYNAMRGFHHREPGTVGAALDSNAYFGLIVDGHHVHPAGVRLAVGAEALDRAYLITDAISASGMPRGKHSLGGRSIFVKEDVARLSDGTIAGSILTMDEAVKNVLEFTDLTLVEAVKMATLNPAKFIDAGKDKGTLEEGTDADIAIFDSQLRVEYTISDGGVIYKRNN